MSDKLSDIDWPTEFTARSMEDSWVFFRNVLNDVVYRYTPKKKKGRKERKHGLKLKHLSLLEKNIDSSGSGVICLVKKIVGNIPTLSLKSSEYIIKE